MRALGKRFLLFIISAVLAGLFAAVGGYYLARRITINEAEKRLDAYASQIIADSESSSSELRTVLAAMKATAAQPCSAGDLDMIRRLIFESDYVRDAGRMQDGKALCSAGRGKIFQPQRGQKPQFTLPDGLELYSSFSLSDSGEMVLNSDGAFVVFTPVTRLHLEPPPMHFQETAVDAPRQKTGFLQGEPLAIEPSTLRNEGLAQIGESLYATECSIRFFNCVTAFTTVSEMAAVNRVQYYGCIAFCAMLGALVGLALCRAYHRQKSLEKQLRRAIAKGKLRVVYQPIVAMRTRCLVGAESLTRWTSEEGVEVSPDVFIKLAEENGFISELTRMVVRRVLNDMAQLLKFYPEFRISINASAADLCDPGFLPFLEESIAAAKVSPASLVIEITESSTARQAAAKETIAQLRARGHHVHIDDFGTGYSNLAHLHDLAVNAIKIDRSFTVAIGTGSVMVSIFPQILAMAKALGLGVIVEGVETEEQVAYFNAQEEGILGQGWLFGRPMPVAQFRKLLVRNRGVETIRKTMSYVQPDCARAELSLASNLSPLQFLPENPEGVEFDRTLC